MGGREALRACIAGVLTLVVGCTGDSSTSTDAPSTTSPVPPSTAAPVPTMQPTTVPVTVRVDADPASLAAELSVVEGGIRAPDVSPSELADLGVRQQLAYRAVGQNPEWHADLLALVEPVALVPLTNHLAARQALVDHSAGRPPSDPPTDLPAWSIVEPLPIDVLRGYYDEAESLTGVPWQYLAAIHFQETRMGRVVGVSTAGAVGPMQFLPSTWEQCCVGDPVNAREAIIGAATYLVLRGAPADMQAALYGYNPNAGYVGAVTAYAQNLLADERAYLGYHGWQVFVSTSEGTVRLPVGYDQSEPIPVADYLARHPDDLVP